MEENPNHVSALEKVASKRGKRITATVSGSKRKKPTAPKKSLSKGIVIREPATSQSRKQPVPKDVLGKKIVRKTRAKRKRSAALPSPILHESPSSNTRSKRHATATTYSEAKVCFSYFTFLCIALICFFFFFFLSLTHVVVFCQTKRRNEGVVHRPLTVSV